LLDAQFAAFSISSYFTVSYKRAGAISDFFCCHVGLSGNMLNIGPRESDTGLNCGLKQMLKTGV
jgi:hypothetical protein